MKSTKQVLITLSAVILLLMPTSAVAVSFIGEDAVSGQSGGVDIDFNNSETNLADLENALGLGGDVLVKVSGTVHITHMINVVGVHRIESENGATFIRDSSYTGIMFNVNNDANLTIGGAITFDGNKKGSTGSVLYISEGATASMEKGVVIHDSVITGNSKEIGTVTVKGSFTMNGGEIRNNTCAKGVGGGLTVFGSSASFTMNGGKIAENVALNGAGVRLANDAIFTMNAGEIIENIASNAANTDSGNGGGIAVASATFIMNNGTIANNEAKRLSEGGLGSGLYLFSNVGGVGTYFYMYGGEIRYNHGSGNDGLNTRGFGDQICSIEKPGYKNPVITIAGGAIREGTDNTAVGDDGRGSAVYIKHDTDGCVGKMMNTLTIEGVLYYEPGVWFVRNGSLNVSLDLRNGTDSGVVTINGGEIPNASPFQYFFGGEFIEGSDTVYVSDSGDDSNIGTEPGQPLKTLDAAFEMLSISGSEELTVYVVDKCTISSGSEISISKTSFVSNGVVTPLNSCNSLSIIRYIPTVAGDTYSYMFHVVGGTLTLSGIAVDGMGGNTDIVHVNSSTRLNIDSGTTLKNNKYAAIVSYGETVVEGTITGCDFISETGTKCSAVTVENGYTYLGSKAKINSNSTKYNGGAITVRGNGELCIDGATISNNTAANNGGAIRVEGKGSSAPTVTMHGGEICGNEATTGNASAVSVSAGEFIFNNGSIHGNNNSASGSGGKEDKGRGAVHVFSNLNLPSTFTMNGGEIYGNTSPNGAGYEKTSDDENGTEIVKITSQVYVTWKGLFNLNGGVISDDSSLVQKKNGSILFANVGDTTLANIKIGSGYEHNLTIFCAECNASSMPYKLFSIAYENSKHLEEAGNVNLNISYAETTTGGQKEMGFLTTASMNGYYRATIPDVFNGKGQGSVGSGYVYTDLTRQTFENNFDEKTMDCMWYKASQIITSSSECSFDITGDVIGSTGYAYDGSEINITANTEVGVVTNMVVNGKECVDSPSSSITKVYKVGLDGVVVNAVSSANKATIEIIGDSSIYYGTQDTIEAKVTSDEKIELYSSIITDGFTLDMGGQIPITIDGERTFDISVDSTLGVGTYAVGIIIYGTYEVSGEASSQVSICSTVFNFTVNKGGQEKPDVIVVNGYEYGIIAGITEDVEIKYNDAEYVRAEPTNGIIDNLAVGTYKIRYAANENYEESEYVEIFIKDVVFSATVSDADGLIDERTIHYMVGSGGHTFNVTPTGDITFISIDSPIAFGFDTNESGKVITFDESRIDDSVNGCFAVTFSIGDNYNYSKIFFFIYIVPESEFIADPVVNLD